jgi:hypothetical protein
MLIDTYRFPQVDVLNTGTRIEILVNLNAYLIAAQAKPDEF